MKDFLTKFKLNLNFCFNYIVTKVTGNCSQSNLSCQICSTISNSYEFLNSHISTNYVLTYSHTCYNILTNPLEIMFKVVDLTAVVVTSVFYIFAN